MVTDDSGLIGLGGVMGGETTEMSATTTRVLVEAAHWDAVVDVPHRQAAQDQLRGRQAQRARRRPDHLRARGRPRGRAADDVRRRHRRPRRHRRRAARRRARRSPVGRRPGPPGQRDADRRRDRGRAPARRRLRGRGSRAARCSVTPPQWRPDLTDPQDFSEEVVRVVGYDKVPSVLPTPPSGRGLTREQRLRRRVGRTMAGQGFVEVLTFPFVGTERPRPARPARRRRPALVAAAEQPAQRRGAVHDDHAAARAAAGGGEERRARHDLVRDLRERAGDHAPRAAARRRSCPSTGAPRTPSSRSWRRRCRPSRCTWVWSRSARPTPPAGGGRVDPSTGPTPSRPSAG